jgi:hypothetical protein
MHGVRLMIAVFSAVFWLAAGGASTPPRVGTENSDVTHGEVGVGDKSGVLLVQRYRLEGSYGNGSIA